MKRSTFRKFIKNAVEFRTEITDDEFFKLVSDAVSVVLFQDATDEMERQGRGPRSDTTEGNPE